ncbi:MAG: hypothetical protein RL757_2498 [Bacteroidota bacterium]|jgi:tetrahydromethanopterin S-methyltransferase subunit C
MKIKVAIATFALTFFSFFSVFSQDNCPVKKVNLLPS